MNVNIETRKCNSNGLGSVQGLHALVASPGQSPITFEQRSKGAAVLSFHPSPIQAPLSMDLPLPDLASLPGQQAYYLYGFAVLLLLLLLVVFRAISGPSKQASAVKKVKGMSNVLFVGPMASGKTSLFGRVSPTLSLAVQSQKLTLRLACDSLCTGLLHQRTLR